MSKDVHKSTTKIEYHRATYDLWLTFYDPFKKAARATGIITEWGEKKSYLMHIM